MSDETTRSPILAPSYALHRVVSAADSLPIAEERLGMNMQSYGYAHVQVVPIGGANPNVQVLYWSAEAGKFIDEHVAIAKAGVGVNTPYEFTVDCRGRIMFVAVTGGMTSGSAKVLVAGYFVERV